MVVVARTPSGACTQRDQGARPRIFPTLARARTLGACTYEIKTLENIKLCREVEELQLKLEDIQKGSFKHFMLKERPARRLLDTS